MDPVAIAQIIGILAKMTKNKWVKYVTERKVQRILQFVWPILDELRLDPDIDGDVRVARATSEAIKNIKAAKKLPAHRVTAIVAEADYEQKAIAAGEPTFAQSVVKLSKDAQVLSDDIIELLRFEDSLEG